MYGISSIFSYVCLTTSFNENVSDCSDKLKVACFDKITLKLYHVATAYARTLYLKQYAKKLSGY